MKKIIIALLPALLAMTGCKIEGPDFFVPEVSFAEAGSTVDFKPEGGTYTFELESNCDWSVSCPADWVELRLIGGDEETRTAAGAYILEVTIAPTKLPRSTTITLYSNEVESRTSVIKIEQSGVVEISTVNAPIVSNTSSATGTTASVRATYTAISLSDSDVVTAGFRLTPQGGATVEVASTLDRDTQTIEASLTDLTQDMVYECVAWARLNSDPEVVSEPTTFQPTLLPTELKSVGDTNVSGAKSATGTTASFESTYVAVSLGEDDVITAGFTVTDGTTTIEVEATVDKATSKFSGSIDNLTVDTSYTVTAWASLNGEARIEGAPATFTTGIVGHITVTADFTKNDLWGLPTKNSNIVAEAVTRTDSDGYTWTIFGGCIDGCLWLACQNKSGFNGYIILPQLKDHTVQSISAPNDGGSTSARLTLWVSNDNGASWETIPGFVEVKPDDSPFVLTDQKPGAMYKIEDVMSGSTGGYLKNKKLIIEAE